MLIIFRQSQREAIKLSLKLHQFCICHHIELRKHTRNVKNIAQIKLSIVLTSYMLKTELIIFIFA